MSPRKDDSDSLDVYLKEANKFPLLEPQEEKDLAKKMKKDLEAKKQFIGSNLKLVISIAKRYVNCGMDLKDIVGYGNIGLLKAVQKFKLSKECKFSTYATWWIRQSIERNLADCGTMIRLPTHVVTNVLKVDRASKALLAKGIITNEDLAEITQLSMDKLKKTQRVMRFREIQSLEHSSFEDGITLGEILEDDSRPALDEIVFKKGRRKTIESAIGQILGETEALVIKARFGLNEEEKVITLEQLGKQLGKTRERIRQIEEKSLKKLHRALTKTRKELGAKVLSA